MSATLSHRRSRAVHAGLVGGLAILAVLASACTANAPATGVPAPGPQGASNVSSSAATQTSEGGQVTVAVTWAASQPAPRFDVALNTHSVDLDGVDLLRLAVLRTDQGVEVQPSGWDAPKGGHHRSGTLTFPATTLSGAPVLGDDTHSVQLVIRDVAGVPERDFQWAI